MLPERLKTLRLEAKLTQNEIAKKLQISKMTYSYWENGKRNPKNVQQIADFFNVSTDYLLGNTDIKNQNQFDEDFLILRKGDTVPHGFTFPVSTK